MQIMNEIYARDLDLNLLRVFAVVASQKSVTLAAGQLYLTQPAVSAALARLTRSVGAPLFVRAGRGLALTARGERLYEQVAPLLRSLVDATLSPARFDAKTSERVLRIGISDALEGVVLAPLMRLLEHDAPRMRLIVLPVQFRTVGEALSARRVDVALSVADELPPSMRREQLFHGDFVCLFDAQKLRIKQRLTERDYFAHGHVIVSYNGDLRGVVEDFLHKQRDVRCSVASFGQLGAVLAGSSWLATVPRSVARHLRGVYPHFRSVPVPLPLEGTPIELLWPAALDDDEAFMFVRDHLARIARRELGRKRA
jgi:LysR family transcriptional regulator, mexEF-oprN operon transcriptional activator